ncbi:hypothetical protein ACPA9J_00790 [Pseudomonas aeruginosa]
MLRRWFFGNTWVTVGVFFGALVVLRPGSTSTAARRASGTATWTSEADPASRSIDLRRAPSSSAPPVFRRRCCRAGAAGGVRLVTWRTACLCQGPRSRPCTTCLPTTM